MKKDQKALLKQLKKLAKEQGKTVEIETRRAKGSHILVRCGDRVSTIPATVGPALKAAIIAQLGLDTR